MVIQSSIPSVELKIDNEFSKNDVEFYRDMPVSRTRVFKGDKSIRD